MKLQCLQNLTPRVNTSLSKHTKTSALFLLRFQSSATRIRTLKWRSQSPLPYRLAIALYFICLCSLSVARYLVYTKFRKNASTFSKFFHNFLEIFCTWYDKWIVRSICWHSLKIVITWKKFIDLLKQGGLSKNEYTIDKLQPCSKRGNCGNHQNSTLFSGAFTPDTQYLHRWLWDSLL